MPRSSPATSRRPNADGAWKQALERLLPDFLALAHPRLHDALDWSQPIALLDKELQAITRQGRKGRRAVDLLASVRRKDGQEQWVLVHVEVQGQAQDDFARRMFTYHARLTDRYDRPVVSLAVLTDREGEWRPNEYRYDHWDCAVQFRYPILKVLDWRGREAELVGRRNPFAQVLLAQLAVLTAPGQIESLAATRLAILRRLLRAGYTDEQIYAVLTFLDWIIVLPEEVEARVDAELAALEGVTMVQLKPRWETLAEQRGEQRGIVEGQRTLLLALLTERFGPPPDAVAEQIGRLPAEQLLALGQALLRFTGPADLETWLAAHAGTAS